MRVAEHSLEALCPLWFRFKKIRDPPGTYLPNEEYAVGNPEPLIKPGWIRLPEVPCAEDQTDGKRYTLHEGYKQKTLYRVLVAYCGNVVESAERNPIVKPSVVTPKPAIYGHFKTGH